MYPFANLAPCRRGLEGWPGEPESTPGSWGINAVGGIKQLGFTLSLSLSHQWLDDAGEQVFMGGPMWGVNLQPNVAYLGKTDYNARRGHGP